MKLSNTVQRRVIMDELRALKTHPTADELYRIVRIRLPKISLGTVYRNLSILADSGMIRRLDSAGRQTRFDADISPHYHLCCDVCGAVEDLSSERFRNIADAVAPHLTGRIRNWNIDFSGLCRSCEKRIPENDV